MDQNELDRIRSIEPNFTWKGAKDVRGALEMPTKGTRSEHELLPLFRFGPEQTGESMQSAPRLFSTDAGVIGLVPSNVRVGDKLFHFLGSDVVAVLRLEDAYVRVVGRAAIANADIVGRAKRPYSGAEKGGRRQDAAKPSICMNSMVTSLARPDLELYLERTTTSRHLQITGCSSQSSMANLDRLYQLLRLDDQEIRLLRLHPDRNEFAPVKCTLFKSSLKKPENYRALSYVWGDGKTPKSAQINGLETNITENLFSALRHLRRIEGDIVYWIDALCINQTNNEEKNVQVRKMRDIYQNATRVTVWLGDPGVYGHIGIGMMKAWAEEAGKAKDKHLEEYFETASEMLTEMWDATRDIFSRPYWNRMWVYQEFVAAPHVDIRCGYKEVQIADFVSGTSFLKKLRLYGDTPEFISKQLEKLPIEAVDPFVGHFVIRQRKRVAPEEENGIKAFDLRSLLLRTCFLNSMDPRDKIYGMMGVDEVGDIPVEIDYNRPIAEVYGEVVHSALTHKTCLFLVSLAGVGIPSTIPSLDLPSWVPDFRADSERNGFSWFLRRGTFAELTRFSASAELPAKGEVDDSLRILKADSIVAGTVTKISKPGVRDIECWRELAMGNRNDVLHPTGIPMWQVLFRTTIGDFSGYGFGRTEFKDDMEALEFYQLATGFLYMGWMESPQWETDLADIYRRQGLFDITPQDRLDDFVVAFAAWRKDLPTRSTSQAESLEAFTGSVGSESKLWWPDNFPRGMGAQTWQKLFERQAPICRHKTFFVTKENYIGLGPTGMQQGDQICVLLGCQITLVIRRVERHYLIVGACYVYGMMKGEVVKSMEEGQLHTTRLEFH
ncbi:hypothetical protein VTL71DRAFT_7385 [Oculimacula yallundae]|uniref:Heterokaryon incompatibility domain-containing protein n=1 Tax=Oculimacula yallundae TaxID=86028 RepID=A0ABR4BUS1_9HELO